MHRSYEPQRFYDFKIIAHIMIIKIHLITHNRTHNRNNNINTYNQVEMNCKSCYQKEWCICRTILQIYKKKLFNGRCVCCYERIRTIKEAKTETNSSSRQQMKQLFAKVHQAMIDETS